MLVCACERVERKGGTEREREREVEREREKEREEESTCVCASSSCVTCSSLAARSQVEECPERWLATGRIQHTMHDIHMRAYMHVRALTRVSIYSYRHYPKPTHWYVCVSHMIARDSSRK